METSRNLLNFSMNASNCVSENFAGPADGCEVVFLRTEDATAAVSRAGSLYFCARTETSSMERDVSSTSAFVAKRHCDSAPLPPPEAGRGGGGREGAAE